MDQGPAGKTTDGAAPTKDSAALIGCVMAR